MKSSMTAIGRAVLIVLIPLVTAYALDRGTRSVEADRPEAKRMRQDLERSTSDSLREPVSTPPRETSPQGIAAGYQFDWYSLNGGGTTTGSSANWTLEASVGQQLAGSSASTNYSWEVGFWLGEPAACPIVLPGDVNASGTITTADIIHLVNFVLKLGAEPEPCVGAGDVNCDGNVVTSDIIYMVNNILKAGPDICDICATVPGTWTCP